MISKFKSSMTSMVFKGCNTRVYNTKCEHTFNIKLSMKMLICFANDDDLIPNVICGYLNMK
jgi:hypothetical protein